jgi:hypothetical protein
VQVIVFAPCVARTLAINFTSRRQKKLPYVPLSRKPEQLLSRVDVGFNRTDWIIGNKFDAHGGSKVVDDIDAVDHFPEQNGISYRSCLNHETRVATDRIKICSPARA